MEPSFKKLKKENIPETVMVTVEEANAMAENAAEKALDKYRSQVDSRGDGGGGDKGSGDSVGIDNNLVKQLQGIAGIFNAVKEFSSSPLQKVIEGKVGEVAAGVVETAFSGKKENKDFFDKILNSQFAYGLGSGIGNKSPELIEAMSRNFGQDKTQQIIDNVITAGGKGGGIGGGGSGSGGNPGAKSKENIDLLLSLDPNNSEHIIAYAESQGGLPPDVARKMLMIHQDAIIKRLKEQGMVIDNKNPVQQQPVESPRQEPVQQQPVEPPVQQPNPYIRQEVKQESPVQEPVQHLSAEPISDIQDVQEIKEPIVSIDNKWDDESDKVEIIKKENERNQELINIVGSINEQLKLSNSGISAMASELTSLKSDYQNTVAKLQEDINSLKITKSEERQLKPTEEIKIATVEEKRPIIPIKKSDISKKITPSFKKVENNVSEIKNDFSEESHRNLSVKGFGQKLFRCKSNKENKITHISRGKTSNFEPVIYNKETKQYEFIDKFIDKEE